MSGRNIARTDWKVYKPGGEYTAATKEPEEAAMLVAALGDGAQIRYKHHTLAWTEGKERHPAAENFDRVAITCVNRVNEARSNALRKAIAEQTAARSQPK